MNVKFSFFLRVVHGRPKEGIGQKNKRNKTNKETNEKTERIKLRVTEEKMRHKE